MAKKWTHTAAFAYFGAKPRNVQWSWSAKSDTGKIVVTLWQDQFTKGPDGILTYKREATGANQGDARLGFHELMDNLSYAQANSQGVFNVIVAKAKDLAAHPRSIERCFPSDMVMRLVAFDSIEGTFTAVQELTSNA